MTLIQQRIYDVIKQWDKCKYQKWVDSLKQHTENTSTTVIQKH